MSQDSRTLDNRSRSTRPNPAQPHMGASRGDTEGSLVDSSPTNAAVDETFSEAVPSQRVTVATALPKHQLQADPQPSSMSVENPTLFAETSADDLMQEVFGDVDRMLQKGVSISPETSNADYVDLKPLPLSDLNLETGGVLATRTEEDAAHLDVPEHSSPLDSTTDRPVSTDSTAPAKITTLLLRFALVVSASVALGVGLAVWMAQRSQTQVATSTTPVAAPSGAEATQTDFADYMTESLAAIDTRYEQTERFASAAVDDNIGDDTTASDDSSTPLPERVYIPVYQPPQIAAALPSLPAPPLSNPAAPSEPDASSPNTANTAAANPPSTNIPNISPNTSHALVGLLELGDRSAAIFEYSGTAHRIEVGAQIGSSGWSLVSVSAQEAIIRRNGDVRSVYIGQSF